MKENNIVGYDIIGDIHGHGSKLKEMLNILGYKNTTQGYQHSERKLIFLGDLIDRGEHLREHKMLLDIAKDMVENKNAEAIMGNHEFNALSFHTYFDGKPLREHSSRNVIQHQAFLNEFNDHDKWYYLDFFKTIPLFYENSHFRCVHACWDHNYVEYIRNTLEDYKLTEEFLINSNMEGSTDFYAIETLLKGVELEFPDGIEVKSNDGNYRSAARVKWWTNDFNGIDELIFDKVTEEIKDIDVSRFINPGYSEDYLPLFIGHYWFKGEPKTIQKNLACLDYSIAKGGLLTAYRFNVGDKKLFDNQFVFI